MAQLVREHRREPVLGIHHHRAVSGEGAVGAAGLRIEPEVGQAGVARGEQARDIRVLREPRARSGGSVVVARGARRVTRDGADRAEHPGGFPVRLADLSIGVGMPHERRADRHAQRPVDEVGGADEDRRVEIVRGLIRNLRRAGREQGGDARVVPARGGLVPGDDGAGVLHRGSGDGGCEHRLAEDVARVEAAASAQHVLGVRQPRHLLQARSGDAAAVGAHGAHHLQLLVDDHEELFGLLGRFEELAQRRHGGSALRVAEGARDRVHGDHAPCRAHVRLGACADRHVAIGHDGEGPVRALLVLGERAEPRERGDARVGVDRGREITSDDEVRSFAAADLIGDHAAHDVGVVVVGDVEAGIGEGDRRSGELGEHVCAREGGVLVDEQASQRGAVVVADEPALAHLPERHESQHLPGRAVSCDQRDVAEQVDVHDLAGEHLDRVGIAGDEGEGSVAGGQGSEGGGRRAHRVLSSDRRSALAEKRTARVCQGRSVVRAKPTAYAVSHQ